MSRKKLQIELKSTNDRCFEILENLKKCSISKIEPFFNMKLESFQGLTDMTKNIIREY